MQQVPEHPPASCFLLSRQQWLPQPIEKVFAFFANAANLERITPPWLRFQIVSPQPIYMGAGTEIEYRVRWRGVPMLWHSKILEWQPPVRFVDLQLRGPYAYWHHTHVFETVESGTRIRDLVRYQLPFGALGAAAHSLTVRRDLQSVFDFRERSIDRLFAEASTNDSCQGTDTERPFVLDLMPRRD